MKIPLYKPHIDAEEHGAVSRVLISKKLSRGEETASFEKEFAVFVGKKYGIALNSGTSALHVMVKALGWKDGDEVITTPYSYIASSNCLLFEKASPVFVDIDPLTLNIDPAKIEEKITKRTKGILLVHALGLPADVRAIEAIASKHNLEILEDACEAIGRPSGDFPIGKIGKGTAYSFHENKPMTTAGEGGMIATDDPGFARRCSSIRDQGRSFENDWISHVELGYNFRMNEVQAAFGREQLKKLDSMIARRKQIADLYSNHFHRLTGISTPYGLDSSMRSWFLYFVMFDDPAVRTKVVLALSAASIGSNTNYFPPIYHFPMYKGHEVLCEHAERAYQRLLALPMFFDMTDKDVETVAITVRDALSSK
jgi:perosamine synthetase